MRRAPYESTIRQALQRQDLSGRGYDPRHIEAIMRTEHPTLDALSRWQFDAEVRLAVLCIEEAGQQFAEDMAQSHGM